ncbi:MAG TPA: hypothetical protein VNX21_08635 [Candidatus Thermoplasmatota archaeon]|nr:hypothetical protein [Candidatus Thermoplasmatota archaeon]
MKTPILVTLLAGLFLTTPAWAGTPTSPEVTDAANDAPASVDVLAMWVENAGTQLVFNVKVRSLAQASPLLGNEGAWHNYYRVEFVLSTNNNRYFVEGQIHAVDTDGLAGVQGVRPGFTVTTGVGTTFSGGSMTGPSTSFAGTVDVEPANNLIKIRVNRGTVFTSGATLSALTVSTAQDPLPTEIDPNLARLLGAGGRVVKDTTAVGRSFVI